MKAGLHGGRQAAKPLNRQREPPEIRLLDENRDQTGQFPAWNGHHPL